jgi:hypothetical protein
LTQLLVQSAQQGSGWRCSMRDEAFDRTRDRISAAQRWLVRGTSRSGSNTQRQDEQKAMGIPGQHGNLQERAARSVAGEK